MEKVQGSDVNDVRTALKVNMTTAVNAVKIAMQSGRDKTVEALAKAFELALLIAGDESRETALAQELARLEVRCHRDATVELRVIKAVFAGSGRTERRFVSDCGRVLANARADNVLPDHAFKIWVKMNGGISGAARLYSPTQKKTSKPSSRATSATEFFQPVSSDAALSNLAPGQRDIEQCGRTYFVPSDPIGKKGQWLVCKCLVGEDNRVTIYEVSDAQAPDQTSKIQENGAALVNAATPKQSSSPHIASNDNASVRSQQIRRIEEIRTQIRARSQTLPESLEDVKC